MEQIKIDLALDKYYLLSELNLNLDQMSPDLYNKEARKQMSYQVYNQKRGRRRQ